MTRQKQQRIHSSRTTNINDTRFWTAPRPRPRPRKLVFEEPEIERCLSRGVTALLMYYRDARGAQYSRQWHDQRQMRRTLRISISNN